MKGIEKIHHLYRELNIQGMLITSPHSLRYYTGFTGGEGMLYLSPNHQILLVDSRYTEAAEHESCCRVVEFNAKRSKKDILIPLFAEDKVKRLGYEDRCTLCSELEGYKSVFPSYIEYVPMGNSLELPRQVKEKQEIDCLREAERIGDIAFSKILNIIRVGMTELEIKAELEYIMAKHGATGTSFDTIVASGMNSSMPHAVPTERKIEFGDFITMDFGCKYQGYCSDMTRTIVVGKANDKQKEIYHLVLKAQQVALSFLHSGMVAKEVDQIARDIIRQGGYGEYFGHGLGHSVGLEIHENPACNTRDHTVLKEGMIMTVEPGIYVPGFGGVRIEDMVVVEKNGIENLTHSPKHLIEL